MIAISIFLATAIRLLLFQSEILNKLMIGIAVNTPITSWDRGMYMVKQYLTSWANEVALVNVLALNLSLSI